MFKTYSLALFDVLDKVGASEYIRHTRRHAVASQEILISIAQNAVCYITGFTHIFGSSAEGTSTPGLQSDIDTVVSAAEPTVVERLIHAKETPCFLMIQDKNTPPGYTKLLLVEDGTLPPDGVTRSEDEALDAYERPVYKNKNLIDAMTYDERNGPAGTTLKAEYLPALDYVPAFRCKRWPSQATDWLIKQRPYSFPSANVSADFEKYGFFVVPVGHPSSPEKPLEWRISFSIQERKMMSSLNPVQFKCYVAMKMIKNDFIKPNVAGKSLTSYHCKTCIFYTLEKTNPAMFIPENFVACLMKCMSTLVQWLTEGFLPNYFIPSENMWKGSRKSRLQVAQILRGLLNDCPNFLIDISCDCTGAFLNKQLHDNSHINEPGASEHDTIKHAYKYMQGQPYGSKVTGEENDARLVNEAKGEETKEVDDGIIAEALIEALAMEEGNADKFHEQFKEMFPGAGQMIKGLRNSLAADKPTHDPLEDAKVSNLNVQNNPIDEALVQQQRNVELSLYKWHYWTVDYVFGSAKELIRTTIDICSLDHCIAMHREMMRWLGDIADLSPRMEFTKLEFQVVKENLFPFMFTSLGSQLAAKAVAVADTKERTQYLEESSRLLEMGHRSDALSGKIKHIAILYMQGKYERVEHMLNELDEEMGNHVTSWGRCYRKSDSVHEALCNRIREKRMSTQEVVQESVAACVTYLPTESDLVPKELKYEMYRSVFATTPHDEYRESWFDSAVIDAKVYMYYLLYKIYVHSSDERSQRAKLLFLIMTLEHEVTLGHPETANNILGCLFKDQGHLTEAWESFAESWMLRPDHNAAKWHMCIMVAEAMARFQTDEGARAPRASVSPDFIEVLYQRKS